MGKKRLDVARKRGTKAQHLLIRVAIAGQNTGFLSSQ
jgi:hypothetical protein